MNTGVCVCGGGGGCNIINVAVSLALSISLYEHRWRVEGVRGWWSTTRLMPMSHSVLHCFYPTTWGEIGVRWGGGGEGVEQD